jgi:YebC/PmpR family DNA-binding regulatory protein
MSGHSKWAQIKRQKGVNDKKRGQSFTKLSKAVTLAVKQGGGVADPSQNFRLRLAIDAARAENMPKENIERAIKRASGKDAGEVSEIIYEGFAPGGVSVMVEAATDNTMRTTSEVKNIFSKNGGSFGQPGSVSYQFKQVGRIIVQKGNSTYDSIFSIAVESGAEDIEEVEDEVFIYTGVSDLAKVRDSLSLAGLTITDAELIREPVISVDLTDSGALSKVEHFTNLLEENEDVLKVYTNLA